MLDTRCRGRVQLVTTRSPPYTRPGDPPTGSRTAGYLRDEGLTAPAGLPSLDSITARARTENFRVASRLLPRDFRDPLMDVYRYARFVDEIGDNYDGDRLAALDWVEFELRRATAGAAGAHPIMAAAGNLVRDGRVSVGLLLDLICANRQDQTVKQYESFEDLLGYCELSANPVGRLVLELFGVATDDRERWSDAICTGLQLVEHWQDVGEDARAGRVYLPCEDLRTFGVETSELLGTGPASPSLRALMALECGRVRDFLDRGAPLIASLGGRLKLAVAGFWAGGLAAVDALEAQRFDPLPRHVSPKVARVMWHIGRILVPGPRR
ncbi:MAG TPA: squalene synthase HpnC [Acidimicrobiales bacterium]